MEQNPMRYFFYRKSDLVTAAAIFALICIHVF